MNHHPNPNHHPNGSILSAVIDNKMDILRGLLNTPLLWVSHINDTDNNGSTSLLRASSPRWKACNS
jgi:hypothetical protein